ncbi:MAG: hypothetical protein IPM53_29880 [Anaerolineaceae bacterium]|nr:hypothetical protein [Anaerolineaceae bacterium]
MERSVSIYLNKFDPIPLPLRDSDVSSGYLEEVKINLAELYHHYYLDTYGRLPPDPDPVHFEYLQFLSRDPDFRLSGDGLGFSTAARRHRSNELGQAFCRWFLDKFLNISYFAHMEHVLNKGAQSRAGQVRIERQFSGDAPDYLCADTKGVYLAEAKGRYRAISFKNAEFNKWRKQFSRVVVKDNNGKELSVKGYIVGTRYATEKDRSNVSTTIYAEDPRSPGEESLNDDQGFLSARVIATHYSYIADKLNQPLLASSLLYNYLVPEELNFPAIVWELIAGPLAGARFVGGYFYKTWPPRFWSGSENFFEWDRANLNASRATFFGLSEQIFSFIVKTAKQGARFQGNIIGFELPSPFYDGLSILRDGSILAPIDFVRPIEQVNFV